VKPLGRISALVTGGAGFIGSHLVDALLETGAEVRVLDDMSTGRVENLAQCRNRIELIEGDIRDPRTCRAACAGVDVVFHQAALGSVPRSLVEPDTTIAINTLGTANVFTAARDNGVTRVVYASSSSVYGDSERLPKREGEEGRPLSPYALSKTMCEDLAVQYNDNFGMEIIGLRYFNIYGSRQNPEGPYAAVIPRFFSAALGEDELLIYGDGDQSRDFTAVADAVTANLLASQAQPPGDTAAYNVASGRRTTVNEIAQTITDLTGREARPEYEPPRPGDVRHSLADLSKASEELGYRPTITLEEGLESCLAYYRSLPT